MAHIPRLFIVVGSPGSGKDILVRAVYDLGTQHADIVSKHTSRKRRADDGREMICPGDEGYNLSKCDVVYHNYGDQYGIDTRRIWKGLEAGVFQVVVVSNVAAINALRTIFGPLVVLIYVHSEITPEAYAEMEAPHGSDSEYIARRREKYRMAFDNYLKNFLSFDHVLIYADVDEDLYDQIFRLFRAYERGQL